MIYAAERQFQAYISPEYDSYVTFLKNIMQLDYKSH